MASKRHQRRRSCESKRKHLTVYDAKRHAKHLGYMYNFYKCPFCHNWHVGRPNKTKRQSIRAQQLLKDL